MTAKSSALLVAAAAVLAGSAQAQTVVVDPPPSFTYEADTVRQLQVRNEWGRYITFTGISTHTYEGTSGYTIPGTPPRNTCFGTYTRQCTTTPGTPARFVPGQPGGTERKSFTYELDCRDRTFDRKGDKAGGLSNKGWLRVDDDPTALAVANKYCLIINTLPGPRGSVSSTQVTESKEDRDESEWTEIISDDEGTYWGIFLRRNGNIAVIREAYVYEGDKEDEYSFGEYNCTAMTYRMALESDPYDFGEWEPVKAGTIGGNILKYACDPR
jgi:hypothetical protein